MGKFWHSLEKAHVRSCTKCTPLAPMLPGLSKRTCPAFWTHEETITKQTFSILVLRRKCSLPRNTLTRLTKKKITNNVWQGTIHILRKHNLGLFWPPLCKHIFVLKISNKDNFLTPPPSSAYVIYEWSLSNNSCYYLFWLSIPFQKIY